MIEWILTSTEGLLTLFSLFYAKVKCDNGISLSLKQENLKMTLSIENSGSNTGNCFPGDERAERQTGRGGCGNLMISSKGPREEEGYRSPTASITWRNLKPWEIYPLRTRGVEETQSLTEPCCLSQRDGEKYPGLSSSPFL